jgi:hypothetical protein
MCNEREAIDLFARNEHPHTSEKDSRRELQKPAFVVQRYAKQMFCDLGTLDGGMGTIWRAFKRELEY